MRRYPIVPMVLDSYFLYRCPHHHVFRARLALPQPAIESGPAHLCQRAHPFRTEFALHRWHHFCDVVVDAGSPLFLLRRQRSSTLCKAPLKKLASSVLSARAIFSSTFSFFSST